jgi:hypothetical protein
MIMKEFLCTDFSESRNLLNLLYCACLCADILMSEAVLWQWNSYRDMDAVCNLHELDILLFFHGRTYCVL